MDINLGDDDGFVLVTAGATSVRVDLYEVNNKIHAFHLASKDRPDNEYNQGLVELMVELGLPRCSHRMAVRFVGAVRERLEELRKKNSTTAGSPASTGSTPAG